MNKFQKKLRNLLLLNSAICIAIATIGFLIIPQVFNNKIYVLQKDLSKIRTNSDRVLMYLIEANSKADIARLMYDNIDILEVLKASNKIVSHRNRRLILTYQKYCVLALDAAICAQIVSPNSVDNRMKEIDSKNSFNELHPIYLNYFNKAGEGSLALVEKGTKIQNKINRMINKKEFFWYICFGFQSFGLIIGLIALFLNKKSA
ncbi:hypothetical protein ACFL2K_04920 [Candidatus Margulisiibacteriota bacterium]